MGTHWRGVCSNLHLTYSLPIHKEQVSPPVTNDCKVIRDPVTPYLRCLYGWTPFGKKGPTSREGGEGGSEQAKPIQWKGNQLL